MGMAMTLEQYLKNMHAAYEVMPHVRTVTSIKTATAAHIPAHQMAKGVLLEDDGGYLMAVVPADRHVHLGMLRQQLGRRMGLATEREIMEVFKDCDLGAVPPIGKAYGIETVLDDELTKAPEVYFEAGNHKELVRMGREEFMRLHEGTRRGHFCVD